MSVHDKITKNELNANLGSLVTIIIATHERPRLLERALNYYSDTGIRILVADSSAVPFDKAKNYNCEYYYKPELKFSERVNFLASLVETKYTMSCSDDDFTIMNSVQKCIDFLEQHENYSAAQGETLTFEINEGLISLVANPWSVYAKTDYNTPDHITRIIENFNDTFTSLYAVRRTCIFKRICQLISDYQLTDMILCEFVHYFYEYLVGYVKVLPILHQCRSREFRVLTEESYAITDAIETNDVERFKKLIKDQLLQYYSAETLSERKGDEKVFDAIANFGCKVDSKNKKVIRLKNLRRLDLYDVPYRSMAFLGLKLNKDARREWRALRSFIQQNYLTEAERQNQQRFQAIINLPDFAIGPLQIWRKALRGVWVATRLSLIRRLFKANIEPVLQPSVPEMLKLPDYAIGEKDCWHRALSGLRVAVRRSLKMQSYDLPQPFSEPIRFNQNLLPIKSYNGLSDIESFGRWSNASSVTLKFYFPLPKVFTVRLKASAFGPNHGNKFTMQIGSNIRVFCLSNKVKEKWLPFICRRMASTLTITIPKPTSPSSLTESSDNRLLGIAFHELEIYPL